MADSTDRNDERRNGWAQTMAAIAVIKEIQAQQAAALLKMDLKLDLLWNVSQRDLGSRENETRANSRWRWIFSAALAIMSAVLAYRFGAHP